jgi:hypothetical protein
LGVAVRSPEFRPLGNPRGAEARSFIASVMRYPSAVARSSESFGQWCLHVMQSGAVQCIHPSQISSGSHRTCALMGCSHRSHSVRGPRHGAHHAAARTSTKRQICIDAEWFLAPGVDQVGGCFAHDSPSFAGGCPPPKTVEDSDALDEVVTSETRRSTQGWIRRRQVVAGFVVRGEGCDQGLAGSLDVGPYRGGADAEYGCGFGCCHVGVEAQDGRSPAGQWQFGRGRRAPLPRRSRNRSTFGLVRSPGGGPRRWPRRLGVYAAGACAAGAGRPRGTRSRAGSTRLGPVPNGPGSERTPPGPGLRRRRPSPSPGAG